ncbi:MAG TPA: oxaloacetate decarboxylase [Bacillota bacterium]
MTNIRPTTRLRQLLAEPGLIMAPGAIDAMVARLVERAGFPAVYMTGGGTALKSGFPDVGLLTVNEMVENAAFIAAAVDIPVIADADTGYGNPVTLRRAVREFERAGVAAIHLEDQVWPKKCGHLLGKRLIPVREMCNKIASAVEARSDPDFVIIARCDALLVTGLDDALARGRAYVEAGADVLFIESPRSLAEIEAIAQAFAGVVPLLFNVSASGKTPFLDRAELERLGYKIAIYPNFATLAMMKAARRVLERLRQTGSVTAILSDCDTFADFVDLAGLPEVQALEERYGFPEEARTSV